jgi:hypothetical protein
MEEISQLLSPELGEEISIFHKKKIENIANHDEETPREILVCMGV